MHAGAPQIRVDKQDALIEPAEHKCYIYRGGSFSLIAVLARYNDGSIRSVGERGGEICPYF